MRFYQEDGLCSLFVFYSEKEAVPMVNADKAKPESDHILSREERIREIASADPGGGRKIFCVYGEKSSLIRTRYV